MSFIVTASFLIFVMCMMAVFYLEMNSSDEDEEL